MNFGENLKTLRKNKKISQEELAEKVGVTRQSVSKWEVGDAYPEMSNIVALCSIFKCNINDLINDNIVDIESFDEETKEEIVKFKKNQQKRMKAVSKAICITTNIVKIILLIPTVILIALSLLFPFFSNTFDIKEDKITILNKDYEMKIDGNNITVGDETFYVETTSNIKEFINKHDKGFFIISAEYIIICLTLSILLTALGFHFLHKLYKKIYEGSTPFTMENEKYVKLTCLMFLADMILTKVTALIYMAFTHIDLNIDLNIQDLIIILIGISIVYMFKYGRMLQADSKAKIYD